MDADQSKIQVQSKKIDYQFLESSTDEGEKHDHVCCRLDTI